MKQSKVASEITGKVWKIEKQVGERVEAGEAVMILESMKMEIPIDAPESGTVSKLSFAEGDSVNEGQVVAVLGT